MLRVSKAVGVASLALLLGACSLFSSDETDKSLEPKPLPEIKQTVKLDDVWSRSVGDGTDGKYALLQPVVMGDTIYASDVHGDVMAMNRENGKVLWEKELNVSVAAGLGASYDSVLVGTTDGHVIALNGENGEEKWRAPVSSEVLAAPQTNGDVVVVLTNDQRVTGLDLETGKQRWIQTASQPVLTLRGSSTPLVTDNVAFVGYANGRIRALSMDSGAILWEQRVAAPHGASELERMVDIDAQPLLDNNSLYTVSYQGNLLALDPGTGRVRWARQSSSYQGMASGYGNIYISDTNGFVSAIDERTSVIVWQQKDLENRQLSAPTVFDDYVVVGDYQGYVHLMSQVDGQLVGRYQVDSDGVRTRPIAVGDMLYVYGNGGKLTALKVESGSA